LELNKEVRIVCLIPARKGSVGLRHKNLKIVGCFTLVNRAIRVAKKINRPIHLVLSTDDKKIIKRYGKKVDTCIERKPELSASDSLITDVISDTLQKLSGFSDNDILLLLEPSSPNRTSEDVNYAIQVMIDNTYDSLATVSEVDAKYHPYKLLKATQDLSLNPFMTGSPEIFNRQQIKDKAFFRNGLVYLYRISTARKLNKSLPDGTHLIVTERSVSNIDNKLDLQLARYFHIRGLFLRLLNYDNSKD
jgi:CMP-N-acetylneuraminic acid synthetase